MTRRSKAILLIGVVSFFAASNGAAIKLGVQEIPPLGFALSRVVVSLLLLLPWFKISGIAKAAHKRELFLFSLVLTCNILFFILGIGTTSVSMAATLYAAVPLLVAILSRVFYQEKLTPRKIVGVTLGLLGTSLVIVAPALRGDGFQSGSLRGNLLIATAVVFFSLYTALSKVIQRHHSPLVLTVGFLITSTLVLLPLAIWEIAAQGVWLTTITLKGGLSLLYTAAAGTIGLYVLYQELVKIATPFIASLFLYLQPILGVILGILIFREQLTPEFVVGALVTLTSIWLVTSKVKPAIPIED